MSQNATDCCHMVSAMHSKTAALINRSCYSLTNLYRSDVFTDPFDEIILVVLPALVRLMNEETSDVQEQAPLVLADLIKDSEDMQKAAFESDTIPKLAELLASVSGKDSDQNEEIGVAGVGSVEKRKEKTKEVSNKRIACLCVSNKTLTLCIELAHCFGSCHFAQRRMSCPGNTVLL